MLSEVLSEKVVLSEMIVVAGETGEASKIQVLYTRQMQDPLLWNRDEISTPNTEGRQTSTDISRLQGQTTMLRFTTLWPVGSRAQSSEELRPRKQDNLS
jgi:hypothetical protein